MAKECVQLFLIDPPWPKKKGGLRAVRPKQGRALDYHTLSVADIFALLDCKILSRASFVHSVFLWTVDSFLLDAEQAMAARGYKRHARFIWDKGNGVAPCFTVRYSHEYLIWYYKGLFIKPAESVRGKYMTVLRERAREHSRKPRVVYAMLSAMYPNAVKLDVFSREKYIGWEQFGDETEHFSKVSFD